MATRRSKRARVAIEALKHRVRSTLSADLQRFGRQLSSMSRAAHAAATALLSANELAGRRLAHWDAFGLGADYIEHGLFSWERSFYPRLLRPASRVLLVGCGSGREMLVLLEEGHDVIGIDPAARAIAIAGHKLIERGARPTLVKTGRLTELQLGDRFDAVIFTWFTYSYILGSAARVRDLERAAELLRAGGRVLISVPDLAGPGPSRLNSLMQQVGRLSGNDWVAEAGDVFDSTGATGTWFQHHFAAGELDSEAHKAGLRIVERRAYDGVMMLELVSAAPSR